MRAVAAEVEQEKITIGQAVAQALEKNLALLAEKQNLAIAEARTVPAWLRPNPVLTVSGDHFDCSARCTARLVSVAKRQRLGRKSVTGTKLAPLRAAKRLVFLPHNLEPVTDFRVIRSNFATETRLTPPDRRSTRRGPIS
jgi:hypothetical protein